MKNGDILILQNLNEERKSIWFSPFKEELDGKEVKFLWYEGSHKNKSGVGVKLCRVTGVLCTRDRATAEELKDISWYLIPETALKQA